MQSGILFSPKEQIYDFFRKMDRIEDEQANQHKPVHSYKLSLIYETRGGEKTWMQPGKQLDCAKGNAQEILETVP